MIRGEEDKVDEEEEEEDGEISRLFALGWNNTSVDTDTNSSESGAEEQLENGGDDDVVGVYKADILCEHSHTSGVE